MKATEITILKIYLCKYDCLSYEQTIVLMWNVSI